MLIALEIYKLVAVGLLLYLNYSPSVARVIVGYLIIDILTWGMTLHARLSGYGDDD